MNTSIFPLRIFPLPGALLFTGMHLPLRVFEPRYLALVREAMAGDRRVGLVQPRGEANARNGGRPLLYDVGGLGEIVKLDTQDDGALAIILEGVARYRILRELEVDTPFRQVEAQLIEQPPAKDLLSLGQRASLESEARRFAEANGYVVDWRAVGDLDDQALVNGVAQVAPFDIAAKQALLEAETLSARAELEMQLMAFFAAHDGEERVTLQ